MEIQRGKQHLKYCLRTALFLACLMLTLSGCGVWPMQADAPLRQEADGSYIATSMKAVEQLHAQQKISDACYAFFQNLLSGTSAVPEYDTLQIRPFTVYYNEAEYRAGGKLRFDFTVKKSELSSLPKGKYRTDVYDGQEVRIVKEGADPAVRPRFAQDDQKPIQAVEAWLKYSGTWTTPRFGYCQRSDLLATYITRFYGDGKLSLEDFWTPARDKFGVAIYPGGDSSLSGMMIQEGDKTYVATSEAENAYAAKVLRCSTQGDITTVTVQFYADCNALLPSHQIAYYLKDGDIWQGSEMLQKSNYPPYGLHETDYGAEIVITGLDAVQMLHPDAPEYEQYYQPLRMLQAFFTSDPQAMEHIYTPEQYQMSSFDDYNPNHYHDGMIDALRTVQFEPDSVVLSLYNGEYLLADCEVVQSQMDTLPPGKYTFEVTYGIAGLCMRPRGTSTGIQEKPSPQCAFLDDYVSYASDKSLTLPVQEDEPALGVFVMLHIANQYPNALVSGYTEQQVQAYLKAALDYTGPLPGGLYEQDGMYSMPGRGGSNVEYTVLEEKQSVADTLVTLQFYADISHFVKSRSIRYTLSPATLEGAEWKIARTEVLEDSPWQPARWGL